MEKPNGTYEAEMNGKKLKGSLNLAFIEIGLEQLKSFRGAEANQKELEWEIRLYEWILAQPDRDEKAKQYGEARHRGNKGPRPKRLVVKELGWLIPEHSEKVRTDD